MTGDAGLKLALPIILLRVASLGLTEVGQPTKADRNKVMHPVLSFLKNNGMMMHAEQMQ